MDLLVEKLDGSRYYLSQYKVLITEFEESAPSVTRNSKQIDQRNGNIDFGGWHTDKTINITGYYRADDVDDEETLREKLYALLSDPDGYYITQLKATPSVAMERPGETSGGYYDKLKDYPSHKRFLVYTEAPEMELVGNVNGTLLYKLTAEFKTIKLPYGETPSRDVVLSKNKASAVGTNLLKNTSDFSSNWSSWPGQFSISKTMEYNGHPSMVFASSNSLNLALQNIGEMESSAQYTSSFWAKADNAGDRAHTELYGGVGATDFVLTTNWVRYSAVLTSITDVNTNIQYSNCYFGVHVGNKRNVYIALPKLEKGSVATDWCPNPADAGYHKWYLDTYYNTNNLVIPYAGTVPCNQLEQGFTIELTVKDAASSLSFKIDETELTYSGAVASGDVFLLNGFSYTQNGLSIVSKTNKAYFILQPDKPNRITCNVHGTVRILGFQNLYA